MYKHDVLLDRIRKNSSILRLDMFPGSSPCCFLSQSV